MEGESEDKTILKGIMLLEGKEKEAMLAAWEVYPTLKSDCGVTRTKKEYYRKQYAKLYLNEKSSSTKSL